MEGLWVLVLLLVLVLGYISALTPSTTLIINAQLIHQHISDNIFR